MTTQLHMNIQGFHFEMLFDDDTLNGVLIPDSTNYAHKELSTAIYQAFEVYQSIKEHGYYQLYSICSKYQLPRIAQDYPMQQKKKYVKLAKQAIEDKNITWTPIQLRHFETVIDVLNQSVTLPQIIENRSRKISEAKRLRILRRDNFTCQKCGFHTDDKSKLHIDHILPFSKGGDNSDKNLQVLCPECNLAKSDKV